MAKLRTIISMQFATSENQLDQFEDLDMLKISSGSFEKRIKTWQKHLLKTRQKIYFIRNKIATND